MSTEDDIPTLTDLIERGRGDDDISLADLGFDDAELGLEDADLEIEDADLEIEAFPGKRADNPFSANPALEQAVRRILDEHMELAWQEIKLLIQRELKRR